MSFKAVSLSLLLVIFMGLSINVQANNKEMKIKLNPPHFKQDVDFEALLEKRFSCRSFQDKGLDLNDIATILWATAGKKYDSLSGASRTIPSAGAIYPIELYLVVGKNAVDKLKGQYTITW